MGRRLCSTLLLLILLVPEMLSAQSGARPAASANPQPPSVAATARPEPGQHPVPPQLAGRSRSYQRESRGRRHSRISKKEVAFMAAIAGTSMGVGALAGGAKGLAIGAIVGGWGAYAGHRLWGWVR